MRCPADWEKVRVKIELSLHVEYGKVRENRILIVN
jgi:hypothetical protein